MVEEICYIVSCAGQPVSYTNQVGLQCCFDSKKEVARSWLPHSKFERLVEAQHPLRPPCCSVSRRRGTRKRMKLHEFQHPLPKNLYHSRAMALPESVLHAKTLSK